MTFPFLVQHAEGTFPSLDRLPYSILIANQNEQSRANEVCYKRSQIRNSKHSKTIGTYLSSVQVALYSGRRKKS